MSKLGCVALVTILLASSAACSSEPSNEGTPPPVVETDLAPLGIHPSCLTTTPDVTLPITAETFIDLTGTSSQREVCDYYVIEATGGTGLHVSLQSSKGVIPPIVLASQCEESYLTVKYFGYIPAHLQNGMWVPAAWHSIQEYTQDGFWYAGCQIPTWGPKNINPSPYTKIRAFTKLMYVDAEYVPRRGPVKTRIIGDP